ncbi:MAG TPA: tail fiber domain-containing protein [Candidatus Udaeobacter sp.]|jgi:hypothetical protein|nr:tail fiber domain-containing protein [Candidatus Udaeobacter sp.]
MKTVRSIFIVISLACVGLTFRALAQDEFAGGNTGGGHGALEHLTSGVHNTALGAGALFSVTANGNNTAVGWGALRANETSNNTAVGAAALAGNTTGKFNSAFGQGALANNTTGAANTALGEGALARNTTEPANTAIGRWAMLNHVNGQRNTALGAYALEDSETKNFNTAIGAHALQQTAGNRNVALGYLSGRNLTTGDNNIDIANEGVADESSTIRIGSGSQVRTFIAGISGSTVTGAIVQVNAAGQLGSAPSAIRFKEEIKPMDKTSEAIFALKPVTFRYKQQIDSERRPQFGLLAEDVEKVDPDLIMRDKNGEIYTVRYDQVNAMLLNEFLKEHRHVQEQDAIIAEQQQRIEKLAAGLKAVSARLEINRPASQTALNQ